MRHNGAFSGLGVPGQIDAGAAFESRCSAVCKRTREVFRLEKFLATGAWRAVVPTLSERGGGIASSARSPRCSHIA
jgi:hypothetical protein